MKLTRFYKIYSIFYLILLIAIAISFQARYTYLFDFDGIGLGMILVLPLVCLLVSLPISWIDSRFEKMALANEDSVELPKKSQINFVKIFFLNSFFYPLVLMALLKLLDKYVNPFTRFDNIYLLITTLFVSYVILMTVSCALYLFVRKLNYNLSLFYKIYTVAYSLILVVLCLSLYAFQYILVHDGLVYKIDRFIIFSVPTITTILGFLLAAITALIRKSKNEEHLSQKNKNWAGFGKAFLIATLITTCINIFVFNYIDHRYVNFEYLGELFCYLFISSFIIAALTAFVIMAIFHYLRKTKVTAILIALIYIQILFGLFYWGIQLLEKRVFGYSLQQNLEDQYYKKKDKHNEKVASSDQSVVAEQKTDTIHIVMEENKPKPFYLSFLWSRPDDDQRKVEEALLSVKQYKYYFDFVRVLKGLEKSSEPSPLSKIIHYASKNRSDIDFITLFITYRDLIVKIIPQSVYKKHGFDIMVRSLCDSYYDLHIYEDERQYKMQAIYDLMENSDGDYLDKFRLIEPYMGDYYKKRYDYFASDIIETRNYQNLVWSYSFWGRRNHEGKVEETIAILQDIRSLYEDYDDEY